MKLRLVLVSLMAVGVVGCARDQPDKTDFVTFVADVGDVRDIVPATGALISPQAAEIRAPKVGVVTAIHVQEGQAVKAGQILATLEDPGQRALENEASAQAHSVAAALTEADLILKTARADLERRQTLQSRGFVSPAAVNTASVEVQRAEAALARTRHQHRAAQARLMAVAAQSRNAEVRAPLDGVVNLILARVGQKVGPDDDRPLFQTDAPQKELTLEIMVAETDIARVSLDSQVSFVVDAYPDIRNHADLVSISQAPIREGRFTSYRALARYDNFAGVLTPGMSASVELAQANSRNVLRIPAQALNYRPPDYMPPLPPEELAEIRQEYREERLVRAAAGGAEFGRNLRRGVRLIFIMVDGVPQRREVRIGAQTNDHIEVLSGIRKGEVVIVRGPDPRPRAQAATTGSR